MRKARGTALAAAALLAAGSATGFAASWDGRLATFREDGKCEDLKVQFNARVECNKAEQKRICVYILKARNAGANPVVLTLTDTLPPGYTSLLRAGRYTTLRPFEDEQRLLAFTPVPNPGPPQSPAHVSVECASGR
jgi:hypothetical protein